MRLTRFAAVIVPLVVVFGTACDGGTTDTDTDPGTDPDTDPDTDTSVAPVWTDRRVETSSTFQAVYTGGTGAWVAGTRGALYRLTAGASARVEVGTTDDLYGVWGAGDNENTKLILVGTSGTVITYDPTAGAVSTDLGTVNLYDVDGNSTDKTAVSWVGAYRSTGGAWTYEALPENARLNSVHTGTSAVYGVGEDGVIVQRGTGGWDTMSSTTSRNLNGIHGTEDTDLWAVGDDGTILHYDGSKWSREESGVTVNLWGVWVAPAGQVFVVGNNGVALINDGGEDGFVALPTGVDANLYAVWGTDPNNVWAVGNRGAVLRYTGE